VAQQVVPSGTQREAFSLLSLEGAALAPIDRILPARPADFVSLVTAFSVIAWLIGLALAPMPEKFLASPEWQAMPGYLAAHLIAVRLFVSTFTRNFRAGAQHLDITTSLALKGLRPILGPVGALLALAIALPLCIADYKNLVAPGSRYDRLGTGGAAAAVDYWMLTIWCVEWFLNALIWVMQIGFLVKNCQMIRTHQFRSPIELVVHERHYRPFLQMSAEGASIVLGFSFTTIVYLWYTGGELTDYAGLSITAALLFIGFVPPWILLRRKVRRAVEVETETLRHALAEAIWRETQRRKDASNGSQPPRLEQRLEEALTMFRISYLDQLKVNLGRKEARAILLRLAAPLLGVAWQVSQNHQAWIPKIEGAMKSAAGWLIRFGS
jgi:hypothetical protein